MAAIGDFFVNLIYSIRSFFLIIFWWIRGIVDLGAMFNASIGILVDVFDFFPTAVVSSLMAVCGGLLVLRLFGRS